MGATIGRFESVYHPADEKSLEKQRRTRTRCVLPCRRKMLFVLEAYSLYLRAGNRNSHSRNAHPYSRTNDSIKPGRGHTYARNLCLNLCLSPRPAGFQPR